MNNDFAHSIELGEIRITDSISKKFLNQGRNICFPLYYFRKQLHRYILILTVILLPLSGYAQGDTLLGVPWLKIPLQGHFTDIELDEEANIFILETRKHKLHKYFAAQGYDSILSIGGKGIGGEGLNQPAKIRAVNRQALYCLDLMNRRLIVLNTNLKIVKEVNFLTLEQSEQGREPGTQIWPIGFETGPAGDLFLLNQEDNRILKIDMFGKKQTVFGGLDYGNGSLKDPVDLVMNENNLLFVTDTQYQEVKVFDLFGIYKYTLYPPGKFRFQGLCVMENNLLYFNAKEMVLYNLVSGKSTRIQADTGSSNIIDVDINFRTLAILTEKEIILYRL